jgi:NAD(P)-dependent dehydrogenase (short-subunit alcohol dehydrogenase family)
VNHVGHFLLTHLLLDRLRTSAPSRIVVVSSGAYRMARGGLCFDDLQHEGEFHSMGVYAESKLANIYFTLVLAQRLAGTGVTVNALNPGYVSTELGQPRSEDVVQAAVKPQPPNPAGDQMRAKLPLPMSATDGAKTSLLLATSPDVEGVSGVYFSNGALESLSSVGCDLEAAQRLWDESERLIALHPET